MKKVFKIILLVAAFMAAGFSNDVKAQIYYNPEYKYGLFSMLELRGGLQVTANMLSGDKPMPYNLGLDFGLMKRIDPHFRLRGICSINGFKKDGRFNRYAKGMIGISVDFLPVYVFFDYGVNFDPNFNQNHEIGRNAWGLAGAAGIGFQFKLGDYVSLYSEFGFDRVNNGERWHSNFEAKLGFTALLGVTEQDEANERHQRFLPTRVGELSERNAELTKALEESQKTNTEQQIALERFTQICNNMEARLNKCEEKAKNNSASGCGDFEPIYFDVGSSALTTIELEKVLDIGMKMLNTTDEYRLEGWCSNNGTDEKNDRLARERVRNVFWILTDCGVSETRLIQDPRGKDQYDNYLSQKVVIKKVSY